MSAPSRTLLMRERVVGEAERDAYLDSLRGTRAQCAAWGVQFWAFVHDADATRFVEFAEAKEDEALDRSGLTADDAASRWRSIALD